MEGGALALPHFRSRVGIGSPILLSADPGAARRSSGASGRSRVSRVNPGAYPRSAGRGRTWKRDSPEAPPRRSGITRVPNHSPEMPTERAGRTKVSNVNLEVSHHRAVAAVRLLRIEKGKAFVDLLNEKGNSSGENEMSYVERTLGFSIRCLDNRDIRLVTVIVAGTVRWKRYLDYLIMSLCSEEKVFREMEPLLLQILRIGFFEILKLNVPAYAAVDENVRLAKVALRPGAGNLVNAILRKLLLLKEANSLPLPKIEGDDRAQARALSIIYSHPVWMVRRWIRFLGKEEALKLMKWNNSDPHFSIRVNTANGYTRADLIDRLESLQVHYEKSTMDEFVRIQEGMQNYLNLFHVQTVLQAGLLKEGMCAVQDESAGKFPCLSDSGTSHLSKHLILMLRHEESIVGLVVSVVDPQPGETIIDCCAAPGGKTLFMAARLSGQGKIWALDINKGRLRILMEAAKLHNLDAMISDIHADLRLYAKETTATFDKVLLDAPCSGLGVLSKRADLRWNRQFEDLEELMCLQDELLDSASMLVKPGGILVYSTCSIDPEENEHRIAAFVQRHPDFVLQSVHGYVPAEFVTDEGFYSSSPTKHSIDGAFAARLVRSVL
uniref:SAM-dependent MTase RsmB/NOP-type domain-containing protein n=1 Tax=Oryza nivara TaxID=4536 RepID=A0A0E0IL94_ORYNI